MRKTVVLILLVAAINAFGQKLVLPLSAQHLRYEFAHRNDSIVHLAIKPFFVQTDDTLIISPIVELQPFISAQVSGISCAGQRLYYKRKSLALDARLMAVAGIKPQWWQQPTLPFIGRPFAQVNSLYFAVDPRFTLSYHTKYFVFAAGRENFHFGQGFYSVWQTYFSPALPYISATVQVWKVKYVYQTGLLRNPDLRFADKDFFHAFKITHLLDFSFGPLNITMFETVVQDPIDSLGARRGFDFFNYLNPVIFYRAVDLSLGSPDNVLIGLGGSLRTKSVVFYGYGLVDELVISQLLAGTNCWCLKYGINAGAKTYFDLGRNKFFLRWEFTQVRPYTYSHLNPVLAYGNLYQPLAHPLGANFRQLTFQSVVLGDKWTVEWKLDFAMYGQNIDTLNYGQNIFLSYATRVSDYDVYIGQGLKTVAGFSQLSFKKQIKPDLWLFMRFMFDLTFQPATDSEFILSFGLTSNAINYRWRWH